MLTPQQGIHIELNRSDQHIQIGDAAVDNDRFTVEIYWQQCRWLSYVSVQVNEICFNQLNWNFPIHIS